MIELVEFRPEEINETIGGLDALRDILVPVLRRINGNGKGEQDAQQFIRQLTLAKHALIAMSDFLEKKMAQAPLNAPLTMEELREMHGEPVYLDFGDGGEWALVRLKEDGVYFTHKNTICAPAKIAFECGGKVYRRRPEETHEA